MADTQMYSVSIKYKTEGADKAASDGEKVDKSIKKIKTSASGVSKLTTAFSTIGKGVGVATKAMVGITTAGVTMAVKLGKNISNLSKQTSDYIEKVNLFRTSMGSLAKEAEEFVNMGETKLGLDPAAMMDALSSFQNLSEGFGIASDRAYIMSKNLAQLSGDLSSFANISYEAAQKKLMSGFSGQVLPLRQYGIALDQASLQELAYSLGIEQRVKTMTRAQKTELIYYQIMKSTSKMQHDLGRTLMSPANALRVLQNEFKLLARAVGSIFIPIIQKIIPIMRAVTKALTSAARAIAEFFGFKVSDYTVDFAEVGDSIGGIADDIDDVGGAADGAAKKMQKMLMPFDELNNINSPDTSSSGGGGGYGAGGSGGSLGIELPQYDMFEIINDKVAKFGDILEDVRKAAHKFNEVLASINWESIKEGAQTAGENIAKFLNVGIEEIDWYLIGKTLAEGFNTAIETMYGFVTTLNWIELGFDISDTINGIFETVDWAKAGETLSIGVKGVLDTMITTIENLNTNKITDAIEEFLNRIDWKGIFSRLILFINKLVIKAVEIPVNLALDALKTLNDKVPPVLRGAFTGLFPEGKIERIDLSQDISSYGSLTGIAFELREVEYQTRKTTEATEEYGEIAKETYTNTNKSWSDIKKEMEEMAAKANETGVEIVNTTNTTMDSINTKTQESLNITETDFYTTFSKIKESLTENLGQAETVTKAKTDYIKDLITGNLGEAKENAQKSTEGIKEETQKSLEVTETNFYTTFSKIKENLTGNLAQAETVTKAKTDYIKSLITGNFGNARDNAQKSTEAIQKETESNLGKISNSTVFSRIKSSVEKALNNSEAAKRLSIETSSNFEQGLQSNIGTQNAIDNVASKISSILNLSGSAFTWGKDMVDGFKRGINSAKEGLKQTVIGLGGMIKSFLGFSRPDEGPLHYYETWMPDMIKGLSKTLIDASPILDSAVGTISSKIANSLSNITMPEEKDFVYEGNYTSTVIGNIGNRMNNATKDETTTNMIRATYEAVSKALTDNKTPQDNRQIVVNVGNRELYRGYGQYQDEQSNMLGVNI